MARRMTASEKWNDPWFSELAPIFKCLWMYLIDSCNHAGIWPVNKRQAEFLIGDKIDWDSALQIFNGRIIPFKIGTEERWFIPKFLKFQYPHGLSYDNSAHRSVIHILIEYSLLPKSNVWGLKGAIRVPQGLVNPKSGATKGLFSPCQAAKDKDKVISTSKYIDVFNELWAQYPRKEDKSTALKNFNASVKTDEDSVKIKTALTNYLLYTKTEISDPHYIKMAKTWFNNWKDWVDWKPSKPKAEGVWGR